MQTERSINSPARLGISYAAACVVALGLAARLYLYHQNPIINPDGFLYIQQAKAIYYGLFDQVLNCYIYLSPYPLVIAIVYPVLDDWVATAQMANIFFSTLTLIPLYGMLRRFFRVATAATVLLIFALLPAYVFVGRDVMRDPLFWFFSVTGLFLFIRHLEKRSPWLLLCGSVCLAVATWARIEGILFISISGCFLLFSHSRKKWTDILLFVSPYLAVTIAGLVLNAHEGIRFTELLNPQRILSLPKGVHAEYESLRTELKSLYYPEPSAISSYFLHRVRNLIWLIALGSLVVQLAETLYYIFFILLVVGMVSWVPRLRSDRRVLYLGVLSILALGLLYNQIIYNWVINSRFLAIFLLPAFIFMGAGIEKFTSLLSDRFRCKPTVGYAIVCILALSIFTPKTLRANYVKDKLIFPEIGRYISQREGGKRTVSICGAFKRVREIHFYANVDQPEAPCFEKEAFFQPADTLTVDAVLEGKYDYFVWDEAGWRRRGRGADRAINQSFPGLIKIKEWDSRRLGKLILFEVAK